MKILCKLKICFFAAVMFLSFAVLPDTGFAQYTDSPFGVVVLLPGESKTLDFDLFGVPSLYPLMVMAVLPDFEIRQLNITVNAVGDVGTELMLGSTGFFFSLASILNFEFLPPVLFYGNETANYSVDLNPVVSIGFILAGIISEYAYFDDYPLNMSLNLTLSN